MNRDSLEHVGPTLIHRSIDPEAVAKTEASLADLIDTFSQQWRAIVGTTVVVLTIVLGTSLMAPRKYTAYASFMPQAKRMPSSLSGLASQFGVSVPLSDPSESPAYYIDLLHSRDLLRAAVETPYTIATDTGVRSGTLIRFYNIKGKTAAERDDQAIRALSGALVATTSPASGIVRIAVTQRYPQLAAAVVARFLALLTDFNVQTHQSQAAAERRFTERRRAEVQGDMRIAENALQSFLQQNHDYRNAPALVFEQERLARNAATQQQIYAGLSQAYEQAKIEEVRDTPVFTIIETPEIPPRPDSRAILLKGVLAMIVGLTLGLLLAVVGEGINRRRRERREAHSRTTLAASAM